MKMDENTLRIIKFGIPMIIIMSVFIFWGIPNMEGAMGLNNEPCDLYTNASSSDIKYMFGKCYIPTYDYYETNEVCRGGILGIGQSCYESSESHYESFRGSKCIVAKTGEPC